MYGIQGGFIGNDGGLMAEVNLPGFTQSGPGVGSDDPAKNRKIRGVRKMQEQGEPGAPEALQRLMGPQLPMAMGIPGAAGNMGGMMAMLPGGLQGPAQGPNTPVRYYPGMGYGPYGPAGGGLPPTPTPQAAGFDRKFVS